MAAVMAPLADRVTAALSTVPRQGDWLIMGLLLLLLALVSLPLGFWIGFLRIERVESWRTGLRVLATAVVFPALTEEPLFGVLLLPRPDENVSVGSRWLWAAVSLGFFVLSHPLKARCLKGSSAFSHPAFLLLATILGLTCTAAYLLSGSIWPPAVIHWIAVASWLLLLGGYSRIASRPEPPFVISDSVET
jgi:predicted Abi (CAAX) family protease